MERGPSGEDEVVHRPVLARRRPSGQRLLVREAKTDAGVREVDILPVLRGELARHHRKSPHDSPPDYAFPSAVGTKLAESNIRRRVLDKAIDGADKALAKAHEAAATRWPDASQAPPHLRLDPRRAGRRSGRRDGPARAC
jgi:hypothetical protein